MAMSSPGLRYWIDWSFGWSWSSRGGLDHVDLVLLLLLGPHRDESRGIGGPEDAGLVTLLVVAVLGQRNLVSFVAALGLEVEVAVADGDGELAVGRIAAAPPPGATLRVGAALSAATAAAALAEGGGGRRDRGGLALLFDRVGVEVAGPLRARRVERERLAVGGKLEAFEGQAWAVKLLPAALVRASASLAWSKAVAFLPAAQSTVTNAQFPSPRSLR